MISILRHSALFLGICGVFLLFSCVSTVRKSIFPTRAKRQPTEAVKPPQISDIQTKNYFHKDTLVIEEGAPQQEATEPAGALPHGSIVQEFEHAVELFNTEKFDQACSAFSAISQTLPEHDSLRYEAIFSLGECALVRDQLNDAKEIFTKLYSDKGIPVSVLEKVYVRLGQTYCFLKDEKKAASIFAKFRTLFPQSQYIPLANCQAVK